MQIDFHYCCIKVLALAAGFPEAEADIIAYASQYVDDATEHKPIKIDGVPSLAAPLMTSDGFDPTCTAHAGIQYLTAMERDVQRKVYIPFHFLPAEPYEAGVLYDYRVVPSGAIARRLLDEGLAALRSASGKQERRRALIKTGIALHSFADTWSHQRFSGRHSSRDNDVERIGLMLNGKWEPLPFSSKSERTCCPASATPKPSTFRTGRT